VSTVLQVSGLSKFFGGLAAVSNVSFEVKKGELLALIGPNGAGKTTCFNMLMGQLKPTAGAVVFKGQNITGLLPRKIWRLGVGRTFQIPATYPVGMPDQAERACAILAYGDLKRLELAIALAHNPDLLLMDEPTAGMAPSERIALMQLTAEIVEQRKISVFAHAHRIMVLNRGEVIATGSVEDIRNNKEVQEVYLGGGTLYESAQLHDGNSPGA